MLLFNFILSVLIVVTAILWAQMTERSFRVDPWDIDNDVVMLRFPFQWCVGSRQACAGVSGMASVWAPILVNNTWKIDQTASGSMRISDKTSDTAILYVNPSGGMVIGPTEIIGQQGVLVSLIPTAYSPTPMWNSHATMAFSDGTILDSVCHVNNANMCGTLFRSSNTDAGIFTSKSRVVVGDVEYGFIAANLQARVIINASIVITHYLDRGSAVPCCSTISNTSFLKCVV